MLVAAGDRPVTADVGVAAGALGTRRTMTGQAIGTPAYMAPGDTIHAMREADLPPTPDAVPEPLAAVARVLLRMDPEQRPGSAGAVASELEALRV